MPNSNAKKKVQVGGNPRVILKKRGINYDGASFIPQLPDYLGYLFGFALIWLLYTGYAAAAGVFTSASEGVRTIASDTRAVVSKNLPPELADPLDTINLGDNSEERRNRRRAMLQATPQKEEENSSWTDNISLDALNGHVKNLSKSAAEAMKGMFSDEGGRENRSRSEKKETEEKEFNHF